ncbi:MAG TPA: hypothetical protein VJ547_04655 [Candidatus Thermoplasmatota archaeon]|nr:hypothetical protein [Candidatus Thermoplasmatota archaeon]
MPEVPRAVPRMKIDVPAEVARASSALAQKSAALQGAPLAEVDAALLSAYARACLLEDCEAPSAECQAAAESLERLARRVTSHEDADEAAPRALALERAGAVWRACGHQAKAEALSLEAAERWVEAADDVRERQKEYLLRACDSFLGAGRFDRAAGSYARAVALGEDSFSQARLMQPSRGAHRVKLAVLLLAASREADARAVNDAFVRETTLRFERKVTRAELPLAFDGAQALAEAHALAGNKAGERQARVGAVDLALALVKREARDLEAGEAGEGALLFADAAVTEALRTRDDALCVETYGRAARALLEAALRLMEGGAPLEKRADGVRLLFDAGRRFQHLSNWPSAEECFSRAYEVSPKYSRADRRPLDEVAFALFLLKGPHADPDRAETHLKNAAGLAKAIIQAAGVHEDHPSARVRQLILREAFYRRKGDIKRHREVVEILHVAAGEGAAEALERASALSKAGAWAGAREVLDEAVGFLERAAADAALLRDALLARSLAFHLDPKGERPESASEYFARRGAPFDPKALGFDWRLIERALLEMDPPAEFTTFSDALNFIRGRAPKPPP